MPSGFLSEVNTFREEYVKQGDDHWLRTIENDRLRRNCGEKGNPSHILPNLAWGNQVGKTSCAYSVTPLGASQYVFEECSFPAGAGWSTDTPILDRRVTDQVCNIALAEWNVMDRRDAKGNALPLGLTYFGAELGDNIANPDPAVFSYGLVPGSNKAYHLTTLEAADDRFEPSPDQIGDCDDRMARRAEFTQNFFFNTWAGFVDPTKDRARAMSEAVAQWMRNMGSTADACIPPSPSEEGTLTFNDISNSLFRIGSFVIEKPSTIVQNLTIQDPTTKQSLKVDAVVQRLQELGTQPQSAREINRAVLDGLMGLKEAKCMIASQAAVKVCANLPYAAAKETLSDISFSCDSSDQFQKIMADVEYGEFDSIQEVIDTLESSEQTRRLNSGKRPARQMRCRNMRDDAVSILRNVKARVEDSAAIGGKDREFCGVFRNMEFGCGVKDPAIRQAILDNAELMPEPPPLPPSVESLIRRTIQRSFTLGHGSQSGCRTKGSWSSDAARDMTQLYRATCEMIQGDLAADIDAAMGALLQNQTKCAKFRDAYEIDPQLMKCDGGDLQGGDFSDFPQLRAEVLSKLDVLDICKGQTQAAPAEFMEQCARLNLERFPHTQSTKNQLCVLAGDLRGEVIRGGVKVCV